MIKSKSTIDHLTTMKNIAGMYFIDGRWLQHNLNGVAVLYRNGLMSSFDSGLNDIVSSLNDVVDVCVISSQRTIAVQHSQSITFVTKRHQSGKTPYIYETNTLGNVQSMHLFDQDRSLLVMFSDGRFLSVGRVFYSSCTTREPLAYSKLFYRVEPEGTRSKKFKQEDYGIAGITKDNKPFILSDRLGFLISHVLFLENENDIVDCAKANMVQNERFCFLRQDGTVLTLDTDLIRIQDDIGRKTSIRYWNNVRKLISSDDWISAISKDNQFVMVQPSNTNQNILDVAKFTYWVPSKDEEDEFEVGDKGETIYTNEGASVILFLDGSLRITGERNLLPFYPLPIKSGIRRLLRNDRHFIVLGEDGVLWCSKVIFGRDDRRLPDGTKKFNKKFTKWEQARNGIIDIANRGDTVYLKVRQEEFDIINQGEGDKVTPVTDPEFLDFLTSQEYRSIAATRSIQKDQSVAEKSPEIEDLNDQIVEQATSVERSNGPSKAAVDEVVGQKPIGQNDVEIATPPADKSTEITKADTANITETTANTFGPFRYKPYIYDPTGLEITDYTGTDSQVVIPAEIEGRSVLAVHFDSKSNITSIKLPEGMQKIRYSAFFACSGLCSISIPSSITQIEEKAFWNCKLLEAITLPEKISFVGETAFFGCSSLQSINITGRSDYYSTQDGVLFHRKDRCLLAYPAGKRDDVYQIPQGTERIDKMAFAKNIHLKTIIMPDSVIEIGEDAFWGCMGLDNVKLPKALNSVSKGCFRYCESLRTVELPPGIETIEKEAFYGCKSLPSIVLPEGLHSIDFQAFYSCKSLKSITLPESLKVLEGDAFDMCSGLMSITLPFKMDRVIKKSFPRNKHLSMVVQKNSPMEAWVKEKGYQYTYVSQSGGSDSNTERSDSATSYEIRSRRLKEFTADAYAAIARIQAEIESKDKNAARIAELESEILALTEELNAITGWFKGRQRRELQERIEVKKAELEGLRGQF